MHLDLRGATRRPETRGPVHAHTERTAKPREAETELHGEYRREKRWEREGENGTALTLKSRANRDVPAYVHGLYSSGDRKEPDSVRVALFFIKS